VSTALADPQPLAGTAPASGASSERRARARAQAAAIADAPRIVRRYSVSREFELRSTSRRRSHRPRPRPRNVDRPRVRHPRRLIAAAVLAAEVVALGMALTVPAFQVRAVTVTGTQLLETDTVAGAAAVPHRSIFALDADTVRARLMNVPWIADASVTTELPNTVRISVVERAPLLRVRRGGADVLVAGNGATMPAPANTFQRWSSIPAVIDDRPGAPQSVSASLAQLLATIAKRFPGVFGTSVAAYTWGTDDVFSIWSTAGWRAVIGHLDTADSVVAVPGQLSALAALRGQVDLAHPAFGYIDLENAAAPSIGGTPGVPPAVLSVNQPQSPQVSERDPTAAPPATRRGWRGSPASG